MQKLRIVIGGFIGLLPTGGVTWDYIQYPLGFHQMGHDVYYLEDTGRYPIYNSPAIAWDDPSETVRFLEETMDKFGLEGRWAYRDVATGNCYGMSLQKLLEICKTADIFINISISTLLRGEYLSIPNRVLIDSDPMFTQVQDWNDTDPEGSIYTIQEKFSSFYTHFFSFGENIGKGDCRIPTYGLNWKVTRQPVCLDFWEKKMAAPSAAFTTVMNWSTRKKMVYNQEEWGQKDIEFEKFIRIPLLFKNAPFQVIAADSSKKMDHSRVKGFGWKLLDPLQTINSAEDYKRFINESAGEFSVAKETYVKSGSGWFSCRSACYLAAGKPVITQETLWSKYLPAGRGLFTFTDIPSALEALGEVTANPEMHAKAAREIAAECFDSNKVLARLLDQL